MELKMVPSIYKLHNLTKKLTKAREEYLIVDNIFGANKAII